MQLKDSERTRCEIWTRVMGYHRPVSAWNPGKRQEHADRTHFKEHPYPTPTNTPKSPPAASPSQFEGVAP